MRKQIGMVGVDSGTVMFVDPCYVLPRVDEGQKANYEQMLDAFYPPDHGRGDPERDYVNPWGVGNGICVGTLHGDGVYPVYADFTEDGRIKSVTVDFT